MNNQNNSTGEPPVLLHHFLEESARRFPEKVAVICNDRRISYSELNALSNRFCRDLCSHGLHPGDRVALLHENSIEFIAAYFGILKAGAIVAPLQTDLVAEGFQSILPDLQPAAIISSDRQTAKIPDTAVCCVSLHTIMSDLSPVKDPGHVISGHDLAEIIYTSGSAGRPKGVLLTHNNIVANTRSICACLNLTERDIQMVVLPFYYVFGLSLLHTHIAAGGTLVLNNQFCYADAVLEQMAAEKVTGFSGVPSTYAYLLHRSTLRSMRERLPCLRYCSQAGGHMARQIKLDLRRALPDHTSIIVMYGATEASARLTWLDPERYLDKIDSIGREIPGVTISVMDENGRVLEPGKTGELVAAGPNIMPGYYRDAFATARVLDEHGYHTGDMGYRDAEGFLFLAGRRDNQIKIGGNRVDPQEIEDVIVGSGLVIEAVVIGISDDLMGTVPAALVVPDSEPFECDALSRFCVHHLPRYKIPRAFFTVSALPKTGSGKIDRCKCIETIEKLTRQTSPARHQYA
ncbi:MAG: acyl--CoA ligase [Chitinispirillaceae bacterium]|jgi:acyl-CoA synthetase (AMP-forming)/AMP-acid ligase II|nr:acyl--CoA ligase [Chitinispirillaceae bacterium]